MDDLSAIDWSKPSGSALGSGLEPKSSANPSYPPLRPTPSPLASGRNTPLPAQGSAGSPSRPPPPKSDQDSFSHLLSFVPAKTPQSLTLAERQAQLEADKRKKAEEQRKQAEAQFGSGQQLDALGSRPFTPSPSFQSTVVPNGAKKADDDLLANFQKGTKVDKPTLHPPPESSKTSTPGSDARSSTHPKAWGSATGSSGNSFAAEDDDPFGLNELKPGSAPPVPAPPNAAEDDDFLGDLARPVDEVRKKQQQAALPDPGPATKNAGPGSSENARRGSKPGADKETDRAIAELLDYGFTLEQARQGLARSGGGLNVEAAANWLLDDAHRKSKAKSQAGASSHTRGRSSSLLEQGAAADFTKSAAAVGSSLFKTANSLWKTGQKKMQRAVADFHHEGGDPSEPKWMRDARAHESRQMSSQATDEALVLEAAARSRPSRPNNRPLLAPSSGSQARSRSAPRWQQHSTSPVTAGARSRLDRLGSDDDSFAPHVSASRRKKAAPPSEPEASRRESVPDLIFTSEAPKAHEPVAHRPARAQPQPLARQNGQPQTTLAAAASRTRPPPARQVPAVDPSALQSSAKHRLMGTAHFKRGDYAMAHSSYTSSMSSIPPAHPLMIVLLTNRALTALKTGEPKQAVSDADDALKIIGPGKGQGEGVSVQGNDGEEEKKDMKELYGKALSRKAEALEQMEKWAEAGAVWQQCVEAGAGGSTAVKGRQRCQDALAPKPAKAAPKPTAKPRPKPSAAASQKSSEAVTRLREANEAAAKDDDERFALTDKIDARVAAWRDGKRDNLRALLGSLDKVLWENSGWKSVGLHELVMANKVKISYMKAIAKTHPDKLPQDASTEVRLIAGVVFSTLNESWDKFKAENGL
ncbi:hypothetical protein DCS_02810 [Drechmeria coniospora]|uniref:UBA domain-containing protein n=1 Tax=Drechmeria coniospora TaxID=98403 RepID=A0A151GX35_DRECN|nr:hypothetical protein DCS_02810 [Drechmeria coniospora]KYK61667.1 hypothetical protein DCS_02810 [Drechmeria coniospora]